jgi:adenylate kinase family enzyme
MKIWFVVGVSGAGKSHFSEYAAGHLGFFHYEIDQTPHDGITHFGLRTQWDAFFDKSKADSLVKELTKRACVSGCPGAILSFPSNLLAKLKPEHTEALLGKVKLVVLTGDPELCKRAFLQREQETGRNYSAQVWEAHNRPLYSMMEQEWLSPYLVSVFNEDGERKSVQELIELLSAEA